MKYIDEVDLNLKSARLEDEVIFNSNIVNVTNCLLDNCDLNRSQFNISTIDDMLNFTLTLNCHSFKNVYYSECMIYALLYLLTMTEGNLMLRDKIEEIIPEKYKRYFKKCFGNE